MGNAWTLGVVLLLLLSLVARFVPGGKAIEKPLRYVFWASAFAFFAWMSDGRLALFAVIGYALAFASIIAVLLGRARPVNFARLPEVAKKMLRPALGFGAFIAAGMEIGGRWSGSSFVVWRGVVGAALVLVVGTILVYRASHR